MLCCVDCFLDPEIRGIIVAGNQTGQCNVCGSKNVFIYDLITDKNNIRELFEDLLDVYDSDNFLPDGYPDEQLMSLTNELCSTWMIFPDEAIAENILRILCKEKIEDAPELLDGDVGIAMFCDMSYMQSSAILLNHTWDDFTESLKTQYRFHTKYINEDVLKKFCLPKPYQKGQIFHRARISNNNTFDCSMMGAPPSNKASAGRANPDGISCLYLASDVETALNEVRASVHDIVSVGQFEALSDFDVVDLKVIDRLSPFIEIDKTEHAINKPHLIRIANEIAKPLRRNDSPLDYLPTQYISDYIKSEGFNGIEYKSTMTDCGYNIAVFNQELFHCVAVDRYRINGVKYGHERIVKD